MLTPANRGGNNAFEILHPSDRNLQSLQPSRRSRPLRSPRPRSPAPASAAASDPPLERKVAAIASLDALDRHILDELQTDDGASNVELAERVGLSPAGLHKRLKKLREGGVIARSVALLDRRKLGLDLLFFLHIRFKENMKPENTAELRRALAALPEVLECYTLTGTDDALLKVVVADQASLKAFMQRLSESQNVIEKAHTAIVLEELKVTTSLPLGLARAVADADR